MLLELAIRTSRTHQLYITSSIPPEYAVGLLARCFQLKSPQVRDVGLTFFEPAFAVISQQLAASQDQLQCGPPVT